MVNTDNLKLKEGDAVLVFRKDGSANVHLSSDGELCTDSDTQAFATMLLWGASKGWAVKLRETLVNKFTAEVKAEQQRTDNDDAES